MAKLNLRVVLLFACTSSLGLCQAKPPTIQQKSDRSVCANIVALTGNVNVKCSSLTPDQSKLLAKIPTLLDKILANQGDSKVLLDKMDEMIEAIARLNEAASQPPTINYAPGGFATSGGTLYNPQVNNYRDPLPAISVSPSTPVAAQPRPTTPPIVDPRRGQYPPDPSIYRPGASVTILVKGPFRNPAFVADCNVPCVLEGQYILGQDGSMYSNSEDFQTLSTPNKMHAGIAYNRQMYPGFRIQLNFRSLDDQPLTISNVRPYDPNQ
jgi:hypothetical protein